MPTRLNESAAVELMQRAGFEPLVPYPGAGAPWKSKCTTCSQVTSPTYGTIKNGGGCGVCSGKIVIPEAAVQLMLKSNLEPLEKYPGGKKSWKCKCMKCGKNVSPKYADIRNGDGGCKYCGGHFVEPEDAIAVMLLSGLKPLEPYKSSGAPWKSTCLNCGKVVSPHYNSVRSRGSGCKYCAKRFVDEEDAITAMRRAKLEPLVPFPGSQKPWKCKCQRCGNEVTPAYTSIQSGQKGCVYCGGKKVDPKEAVIFMKSKGLEPLEPYKKADKPWKCRCMSCMKEVQPSYSSIGQGQKGCVYCGGKKVDPADAVALFLENNLKPLEPYISTDSKWKSECLKCNRIVYPTHHMVAQRSGGCKYCATRGMDFTLPAFIYLITNHELGAHKVGISGEYSNEDRLRDHAKNGWLLYKKKTFLTADQTYEIEQEVLRWLREDKGLPPYLSGEQMPQRGWTETVSATEIDLPSLWAKVEELSKVRK